MKEYLKKNINTILAIFIIIQPILDIITGICVNSLKIDITFGVIIRMIFMLCMVFISIFIFKKKKLWIPYSIMGLYFILYIIGMVYYKDSSLLTEIKNLMRTFYFPILLLSIYSIKEEIKISKMTLFTVLFLYLIFLFIPTIFGLGYKSYQITKVGTLGFFNSANEISGIISIITPIMFLVFFRSKKTIPIMILSIMYLGVILMVGTKTPLLSLIITLGITMLYLWIKWIKEKKIKYVLCSGGLVLVACIFLVILIPKTNFYKNIRTHLDYLGLNHVIDVFQDKKLIDHFIFSSRIEFLERKAYLYKKASNYEKIFGIGYVNNGRETKLIEMDYFDIYYSHGLVGFLIFFLITLSILYKVLNREYEKTYENIMMMTSLFLIVFLSFFTGHIITAPSVSLLVIVMILSFAKREKKDLLFTSFSMDLGGIEKALLNLITRIDLSKYNITIILEEKRGIFLKSIPEKVKVKELKVSNYKNKYIRKAINFTRKLCFKILNDHNYDFSCCYTTYSYSSSKLALMASDNTAFYVHNDYRTIYPNDKDFYQFFDSREIKKYKKIIFVSNENKDGFIEKYKDLKSKCIVINNFINTEEIKEQAEEKIDVKKDKTKKLFLYVGRLDDAAKKISRQIQLVKEIEEIELWIVGDGPDKEKYEKEVKDNHLEKRVTFFGRKKNPFPYMKQADYVILTSDYEGFPVTYLEAITLGKTIITTFPTSDDYVDIKKCGYVISKEKNKMVKEVKEIIENKVKKECEKIDLEKVQQQREKNLELLFND